MPKRRSRPALPPSARLAKPNPPTGTTPADFQTDGPLIAEFLRQANRISDQRQPAFDLDSLWRAAGSPSELSPEWFRSLEANLPKPRAVDPDGMAKVEAEIQAIHYLLRLDPEFDRLSNSTSRVVDTMEDVCAVFMTYPEPAVAACAIAMLLVYHPPLGIAGVVEYLTGFVNIYGRRMTGDEREIETMVARMQRAIRGEAGLAA